ncbi:unnamed protein product [Moneuplotes crassus]|uniref:Plant heme peroxidase family profile domain-containing protein n=1 Tax=Euplotes crassus TaxID=5936 RepID=A0AAD1XZB7_EUPCR|nr:unnamed protein product [Moneuplotes crassus]
METNTGSIIRIPHKISLLSVLIPYYGYVHECAELFLQLDKTSREVWIKNLEPILRVIMNYEECTLVKDLHQTLTMSHVNKLLTSKYYFSLKLNLGTIPSFKAAIALIDQMDICLKDQFELVTIKVTPRSLKLCNKFLEIYMKKGFDKKSIVFDYESCHSLLQHYCIDHAKYIDEPMLGLNLAHTVDSLKEINLCVDSNEPEDKYPPLVKNLRKVLENNYEQILVDAEALLEIERNLPSSNLKFTHKLCKRLQVYIGREDPALKDPEHLKYIVAIGSLLKSTPNVDIVEFNRSSMFKNLVSQGFSSQEEAERPVSRGQPRIGEISAGSGDWGRLRNLCEIKHFEFFNKPKDEELRVDLKVGDAEIIYCDPDTGQMHVYFVKDFKLKISSDKFCWLEESKILGRQRKRSKDPLKKNSAVYLKIDLREDPDFIAFRDVQICIDIDKKSLYKDKLSVFKKFEIILDINSPICFRIPIKSPLIQPPSTVKLFENSPYTSHPYYLSQRGYKSFPLTYFKNYLAESRPYYTLNIFIEPPAGLPHNSATKPISTSCPATSPARPIDYSHSIQILDSLPEQALLSINIHTYLVATQQEGTEEILVAEYRKDTGSKAFCVLLERLKKKHLRELRSEGLVWEDEVVAKLCRLFETKIDAASGIRDIELNLVHVKHVQQILYSLRNNYAVKTVRLLTQEQIKVPRIDSHSRGKKEDRKSEKIYAEILQYCEEFRNKRIGTEITLNTNHPRFMSSYKKGYSLLYRI